MRPGLFPFTLAPFLPAFLLFLFPDNSLVANGRRDHPSGLPNAVWKEERLEESALPIAPLPVEADKAKMAKIHFPNRLLRAHEFLHRLRSFRRLRRVKRRRRTSRHSISSVLVETASCEHAELIDCGEYRDRGMRCMTTATGMPCCICNGRLRLRRRRLRHGGHRKDG